MPDIMVCIVALAGGSRIGAGCTWAGATFGGWLVVEFNRSSDSVRAVTSVAVVFRRFDRLQHFPDGIDDLQQHARDLGIENQLAFAQSAQQALGPMSDHLQLRESEKTGRSFDGVHGASTCIVGVSLRGDLFLQRDQVEVQLGEVFVGLD